MATMTDDYRKKYIEEPELKHLSEETLANPPKQRTVQQQEKQDKLLAKERRDAGIDTARSRSTSRRDRRKRIKSAMQDGKYMHTTSLEALEEADANGDLSQMGPFERIGPDSTSMDGPVTHARAMRGEIPVRGSNPDQPYYLKPEEQPSGQGGLKDQEGLKLTLEANLEIEIELKASIRGDLTLSLL
ncbi:uncharacterized protein MYCGRDRAFT_66540 [Zymoseptoria tritici IPO323]|uniref:Uncharacterized protein n=1 Tax=Zymoseptoria tritici (strain CBS 115943 / IPO323) TaxID=336722 RepID=F9X087_ZYMTI|nr:uncharacterized protein MYCGRDRAFT_66540 [Zymoseptoria tritici IPO323]EGP92204.1 hypothetical protein MYCGRDRAFT_66540 [Zymoseptoria tritici IPO323]